MPGVVVHPTRPTIAGTLRFSEHTAVRVGSLVAYGPRQYFVRRIDADDRAELFHDATNAKIPDVPVGALLHLPQSVPLLDMRGIASPHTKFGVGLCGRAKQAWLRDGRAYIPHERELLALHKASPDVAAAFCAANDGINVDGLGDASGDAVALRFCEAQAARASLRERQYLTYIQRPAPDGTLEQRAASMFDAFAHIRGPVGLGHGTFIVFTTTRPARGSGPDELVALVGADGVSLPMLAIDNPAIARPRKALTERAERLCANLGITPTPVPFLVHDGDDARVMACPVARTPHDTAYARWSRLPDLAGTALYEPVAHALSHVATFMSQGSATIRDTAQRGARRMRPLAQLSTIPSPLRTAPTPDYWHARLAYAESADTALRHRLLAERAPPALRAYLAEWADRIDTSPNAAIPTSLRCPPAHNAACDPALLDTPFSFIDGVPTRGPPPAVGEQRATSYRPRNVCPDILTPAGAARLVREIRAVIRDIRNMHT